MSNPETHSINDIELPMDISKDKLVSILNIAKVPLEQWGIDEAKNIDDFLDEITSGEAKVTLTYNGELHRSIDVAIMEVLYIAKDSTVYGLREDRQEFNDGRVRRRNLPTSIAIKIKLDETPEEASVRALTSEMSVREPSEIREFKFERNVSESTSFPGVTTYCNSYPFIAMLDSDSFNPNGYKHQQDDRINYYVWEMID